eukprot:RCo024082
MDGPFGLTSSGTHDPGSPPAVTVEDWNGVLHSMECSFSSSSSGDEDTCVDSCQGSASPLEMPPKVWDSSMYHVVKVFGDTGGSEMLNSRARLLRALELRRQYRGPWSESTGITVDSPITSSFTEKLVDAERRTPPPGCSFFRMVDGVVQFEGQQSFPASFEAFAANLEEVQRTVEHGPCRSACRSRLQI